MPACKGCKKSGLFLKLEADMGLCLSCAAEFAKEGKVLTARIAEGNNLIAKTRDQAIIKKEAANVVENINKLLKLQERFCLEPGQELLDLKQAYEKMT